MNTLKNNLPSIFNYQFLLLLAIGLFTFTSCGSDDDIEIPEEEELITTLEYTLTPTTGDVVTLRFEDADGDGGNAPTYTVAPLQANMVYTGAVTLSNDSETPAEDITEEIQEEKEEHQFFFSSSLADLTVAYTDVDADGKPVGLTSVLTTGDPGTGTLLVTLKHEPMKDNEGVAGGDITNSGGETDIAVQFDITVE